MYRYGAGSAVGGTECSIGRSAATARLRRGHTAVSEQLFQQHNTRPTEAGWAGPWGTITTPDLSPNHGPKQPRGPFGIQQRRFSGDLCRIAQTSCNPGTRATAKCSGSARNARSDVGTLRLRRPIAWLPGPPTARSPCGRVDSRQGHSWAHNSRAQLPRSSVARAASRGGAAPLQVAQAVPSLAGAF